MVTNTRLIFHGYVSALYAYQYRYGKSKNSLNKETVKKDTDNYLIPSCDIIACIVFMKPTMIDYYKAI